MPICGVILQVLFSRCSSCVIIYKSSYERNITETFAEFVVFSIKPRYSQLFYGAFNVRTGKEFSRLPTHEKHVISFMKTRMG